MTYLLTQRVCLCRSVCLFISETSPLPLFRFSMYKANRYNFNFNSVYPERQSWFFFLFLCDKISSALRSHLGAIKRMLSNMKMYWNSLEFEYFKAVYRCKLHEIYWKIITFQIVFRYIGGATQAQAPLNLFGLHTLLWMNQMTHSLKSLIRHL